MKKAITFFIGVFVITISSLSLQGNVLSQEIEHDSVICDCSFGGFNTMCLASNWGSRCTTSHDCQSGNSNCGGTNPK
jgi:hypothetical protein